ncbi:hypothetical protein JOB18_031807 [Solea senegalensis]|uniref:Uncharacterized protein n=1 Tax=Solea senegalensis TaxID=28829 RepID=A0AAV6RDN6_SOLSE|nr:hypothetical protein JOB18_031807 [Solea senegalensis]
MALGSIAILIRLRFIVQLLLHSLLLLPIIIVIAKIEHEKNTTSIFSSISAKTNTIKQTNKQTNKKVPCLEQLSFSILFHLSQLHSLIILIPSVGMFSPEPAAFYRFVKSVKCL